MALQVPKRALQKRRKSSNGVRVTAMAATGVLALIGAIGARHAPTAMRLRQLLPKARANP